MRTAREVLGFQPDDEFRLQAVGESFYQDNFAKAVGPRTPDGYDDLVEAVIVAEANNPYDPNAVRVEVRGFKVGYLKKNDALTFRRLIEAVGCSDPLTCRGRVRGGWDRGADEGHYGIWLDLPIYG